MSLCHQMSLATHCWWLHAQSSPIPVHLSLGLCHPGMFPVVEPGFGMGRGTLRLLPGRTGWVGCPAECPVCPQASCSPTSLPAASIGSTSMKPSRCARSKVPSSPASTSYSRPGTRDWTGAMQAGCLTAPCSIPSACPASPVVGCTSPRASAATAHATGTCTALMPSASPPGYEVGAGPGAGGWDPGEDAVPNRWHPMSFLPLG